MPCTCSINPGGCALWISAVKISVCAQSRCWSAPGAGNRHKMGPDAVVRHRLPQRRAAKSEDASFAATDRDEVQDEPDDQQDDADDEQHVQAGDKQPNDEQDDSQDDHAADGTATTPMSR